jgi:hypothetical protein
MEMLNYDFSVCRDLFESAPRNDKEYAEAVKYFHDRCFYTDNGGVYVYKKSDLVYYSQEEFSRTQMMGFSREAVTAIKKKIVAYDEVLEQSNFTIDKENRKINSLKAIHARKLEKIVVGKKGKAYVEFFKKYLMEIVANNNESLYNYLLKWLSCVVKLRKMKTAIVMVSSTEGIGKSSLAKVLEKMLGASLVTYPSPSSLVKFNFQLYGKVLVVLEETEGLQKFDGGLNDVLKNIIPTDTFSYEAKGVQPRDLKNVNNFIITSNFSLSTVGRRFINITPSTKWLNCDDLFEQLYDLDDEKIKALYDFLLEVDTKNFNEEKEGKKLSNEGGNLKEIEKMNNVFRFIKDYYALDKLSEKIKKCNLYEKYKTAVPKAYNKSTFYEKISELNIHSVKTNGYEYFVIDGRQIYAEFKKRNLIHGEEIENAGENVNANDEKEAENNENEILRNENQDLKKQLEEMKREIEVLKKKNAPEKKEEIKKVIIESDSESKSKIIKVKAFIPKAKYK